MAVAVVVCCVTDTVTSLARLILILRVVLLLMAVHILGLEHLVHFTAAVSRTELAPATTNQTLDNGLVVLQAEDMTEGLGEQTDGRCCCPGATAVVCEGGWSGLRL